MGPTLKNNQKNKNKNLKINLDGDKRESVKNGGGKIFIFYFFSLSLLSSIYGVSTIEIRQARTKVHLLDEGYAYLGFRRDFN